MQFFPEGGNLVNDLPGKVAFKAVHRGTGKGVDFQGEILDKAGKTIQQFDPEKFGIGSFSFTPNMGNAYTAVLRINGRQVLTRQLPKAFDKGYTLHLEELNADQIRITLNSSVRQAEQVYLLGHARQIVTVAEQGDSGSGQTSFTIPRSRLADGITHFTVFNNKKQPVSERLYFKRPVQNLAIEAKLAKGVFTTRDQVTLDLETHTQQGNAVPADMSISVYRLDSLQNGSSADIGSYLWLASDLKGPIENPAYYFSQVSPKAGKAVDHLMLTHGWSRFRWEEMPAAGAAAHEYLPEVEGHIIAGK